MQGFIQPGGIIVLMALFIQDLLLLPPFPPNAAGGSRGWVWGLGGSHTGPRSDPLSLGTVLWAPQLPFLWSCHFFAASHLHPSPLPAAATAH